jgi:predicted aspartyl protease
MKYKIKLVIEELERKNYHLFVNLEINGIDCRLLLDTGASKTVFDSERVLRFVKSFKIKSNESKSVGLGVSEMETHVVNLKKITIGKLEIKKMEVAVLPIGHVNTTYQQLEIPEIDGVLGSDFLMKYEAVIDYPKMTMTLKK